MKNFKIFLRNIFIPVLIGGLVGFIISGSLDYEMLEKPLLSPPGIIFPIVWTILYILMGISYSILEIHDEMNSEIKTLYFGQLFLNALWSIFYFILKWRLFAFFWIILLLYVVIKMIVAMCKVNKKAGYLQIPYVLWLFFAAYLNLFTFLLN